MTTDSQYGVNFNISLVSDLDNDSYELGVKCDDTNGINVDRHVKGNIKTIDKDLNDLIEDFSKEIYNSQKKMMENNKKTKSSDADVNSLKAEINMLKAKNEVLNKRIEGLVNAYTKTNKDTEKKETKIKTQYDDMYDLIQNLFF